MIILGNRFNNKDGNEFLKNLVTALLIKLVTGNIYLVTAF